MLDEGAPLYSDWFQITTAAKEAVDFSFILYGDSRSGHTKHRKVVEQIELATQNDPARFLIHTGDMVTNGYEEWRWQQKFFEPVGDLLAQLPIYSAPGNHELNQHQYYDYFPPLFTRTAITAFSLGRSNSFPQHQHRLCAWKPTVQLARSCTRAFDCALEAGLFSSPPLLLRHHAQAGRSQSQRAHRASFGEYGVQLALLGHDHLYGKTKDINGVRYLTSGGWRLMAV